MRGSLASFDARCSELSRAELVQVRDRLVDCLAIAEYHLGTPPLASQPPSRVPFLFSVAGVAVVTLVSYLNWL
jgi:hypothetical protein